MDEPATPIDECGRWCLAEEDLYVLGLVSDLVETNLEREEDLPLRVAYRQLHLARHALDLFCRHRFKLCWPGIRRAGRSDAITVRNEIRLDWMLLHAHAGDRRMNLPHAAEICIRDRRHQKRRHGRRPLAPLRPRMQ